MNTTYDVAAYIWPAFGRDNRAKIFWPKGLGEWESLLTNTPKFEGHQQPRYPAWGFVNEADPYVMEMQIDAAADHGVNVFIYDWYWYEKQPFLEDCLNDGYLKARNNQRVRFYIMWANHDVGTLWNKSLSSDVDAQIWKGGQDRGEFERICHRLIERYFPLPNYYTIDGKPVFMIYEPDTLVRGLGGIEATRDALAWLREQVEKAGMPGLHLQFAYRKNLEKNITGVMGDNHGTGWDTIERLGFDSATNYQFCHLTDIDRDYLEILEDIRKNYAQMSAMGRPLYFPHVSLGWDNNPRYHAFRPGITRNNTPENVEKALRMAKDYLDAHPGQPPLVTINSWNEWTECSYLQPDNLYGYGYLEAVKRIFLEANEDWRAQVSVTLPIAKEPVPLP